MNLDERNKKCCKSVHGNQNNCNFTRCPSNKVPVEKPKPTPTSQQNTEDYYISDTFVNKPKSQNSSPPKKNNNLQQTIKATPNPTIDNLSQDQKMSTTAEDDQPKNDPAEKDDSAAKVDSINMLSLVISTVMLLASKSKIPENYKIWTTKYLKCIKNKQGQYPPNVVKILQMVAPDEMGVEPYTPLNDNM